MINFYLGEENSVVIERGEYASSIFSKQYSQAVAAIYDTYNVQELQSDGDDNPDTSNIVAFCGDRGEGKTSCMKSTIGILKKLTAEGRSEDLNKVVAESRIPEYFVPANSLFLDSIDPAMFDTNHNVLEIVIGLLYQKFLQIKLPEDSGKELTGLMNECTSGFRKVKECLHHLMDSIPQMYDALEEMDKLAAAIQLRSEISGLFANLLKLENKDKIVIVIDDIDLNMTRAYIMAEKIRIFLNNRHCVILMSCKVDQLQTVVAASLKTQMMNAISDEEVQMMSLKYVTKFIPVSKRINMPKVYDMASDGLSIYKKRGEGLVEQFASVQMAVVELIFKRTRYLFYNSQGSVSPIVPNNLRNLRQLISLLYSMENFKNNKESYANKEKFKSYFFGTWTRSLNSGNLKLIERITTIQDTIALNKIVVQHLKPYIGKDVLDDDRLLKLIVDDANYVYNVSVGDLFYVMQYLEQSSTDYQLQQLLFFLKSFYSIQLYEKYDILTETGQMESKTSTSGVIYKTDATLGALPQLLKLVNGSYFSYMPEAILPPSNVIKSRDLRLVDGKKLMEALKFVENYIDFFDDIEDEKTIKNFELNFRTLEFFALTIKRSVLSKNRGSYQYSDRAKMTPQHLERFNENSNYYVFDVMAPFYNILDVKTTYSRYPRIDEGKLYDFAIRHEWSILYKMLEGVLAKHYNEIGNHGGPVSENMEEAKHQLLSNATIRNGEVLTAILDQIKSKRLSYKNQKTSADYLERLYRNMIKTNMNTYDKPDDGQPYEMRFVFLEGLIGYLRNDGKSTVFNGVYEYVQKRRISSVTADSVQEQM